MSMASLQPPAPSVSSWYLCVSRVTGYFSFLLPRDFLGLNLELLHLILLRFQIWKGCFLHRSITMCSFSPPHPTKGEFRIQFLPRPLNECASSVTERGNGMVTFAYWLSIFKERLPLARQGSSAGYTAEKKTELSAVTGLIFWGGDRCFTQK